MEWLLAKRTGEQLTEFLDELDLVAHEITTSHFYKRPGKCCAWCDYLPVCTGDKRQQPPSSEPAHGGRWGKEVRCRPVLEGGLVRPIAPRLAEQPP